MKRALIFGVGGQDGAYMARLLLSKGYQVTGTSRDALSTDFGKLARLGIREQVKTISTVLTDFRSVYQTIRLSHPDEIYNLAGQSSVGLSFDQPVETMESISHATLNLLEAIRMVDWRIRLYSAGSSECFGNTDGEKASEVTPFHPRSPYAVAKAAAYWQVASYREAYGIHASTGILFNHESPLRPARFVTQKIIQGACNIAANRQDSLRLGNLHVRRDWGWAPEYVDAMWRMLQQDEPDDYVVATGQTHSLQDFVATAFNALGMNWRDYVEIDEDLLRPADLEANDADPSKALQLLGWKAETGMQEIVSKMISAAREEPVLV